MADKVIRVGFDQDVQRRTSEGRKHGKRGCEQKGHFAHAHHHEFSRATPNLYLLN